MVTHPTRSSTSRVSQPSLASQRCWSPHRRMIRWVRAPALRGHDGSCKHPPVAAPAVVVGLLPCCGSGHQAEVTRTGVKGQPTKLEASTTGRTRATVTGSVRQQQPAAAPTAIESFESWPLAWERCRARSIGAAAAPGGGAGASGGRGRALQVLHSSSDAGVDAGGCSATRARARCACKSLRIGR